MKKRICAFWLAAAMALGLFGCGETAQGPGPTGGPTADSGRGAFLAAQQDQYDPALVPAVGRYTVAEDFSNVINYSDWDRAFSDEAKQMLLQNGFVVVGDGMEEFFSLYENNRYSLTPNFVTTDAMMHTYHLFFSRLLKNVEREHFCADLMNLGTAMRDESLAQAEALKGTEWENAALRNAAFFSVGLALQQPETEAPEAVRDVVAQELELIEKAEGVGASPVMNLGGDAAEKMEMEDYSQYIPRGYYTTEETLERYFKAMMWYGRLTFRQSDEDQSRSALLMTLALTGGEALETWEKIYTVTSFFVGDSDDAGIYEYAPLIEKAYGGRPVVKELPQKQTEWTAFLQALKELEPPAINSIPIFDEGIQPDKEEAVAGFRFLGQRFTLDASIFQQLVYRQVGANNADERRMLPSALDIPAALGSAEAEKLLTEAGAMEYQGYGENLAQLQSYLAQPPQQLWTGSLYGGWLNTLRPLLAEKEEGWPQFMQNEAWTRKNLNSFLGSWTELKHDTVLYAKQVYAEMGGAGMEERDDRGYVEPEPVLYSRLAGLSTATAEGLRHYGVLRDADAENLARMAELARQLMVISEKELRDELLSDEEYDLIRGFGGQLEHFWYDALADESGDGATITGLDHPAAIVTDVATDPDGGRVLEVGAGKVNEIFVIVSVDGVLRLARGGVFSFYEFAQPLDQRLTDEEWRKMLGIYRFDENGNFDDQSVEVPRPGWTSSFFTPAYYSWQQ